MGMPAGVVPIRNIKESEEYYNTRFNDMPARKLKDMVEDIKGLPVGVQNEIIIILISIYITFRINSNRM